MLMNNLDPEVAERPQELVVYGGIGKAARNWQCFEQIVAALRQLEDDETLLIQSGKPVGRLPHPPRRARACSSPTPTWWRAGPTWEHFNELDRKGLMMFGQMTAGSWIYIGSQGIVQGTYETFVEMGRQHFGGKLAGRWILTAGLGRHGRRAAAGRHHGRSSPCSRSSADPSASPSACRPATSTSQAQRLDEALELLERAQAQRPAGVRGTARQCLRGAARTAAPRRAARMRSPTRPPRTTR